MSATEASHLELNQWPAHESLVDLLCKTINSKDADQLERLLAQLENDPSTLRQLDNQGLNPLHVAVTAGNNDALRILLQHSELDLDIRSEEGHTALQYAKMYKNEEAFRLLISAGCSVYDLMNDGQPTGVNADAASNGQIQSSLQNSEAGQHLLYPITESFYWSVEVYQDAIRRCYSDLTKYMYPELLVPQLFEAGHLTPGEVECIIKIESKGKQAMLLLSILERKGQRAYHAFLRALKKEKQQLMHEELAKKLIECCEDCQSLTEHHDIESSFEQVTTVYVGDSTASMTPGSRSHRSSKNQSFLLESGFHSASLASNSIHSVTGGSRKFTHSSTFSSRKTCSQSHERPGRLGKLISVLPNSRRQRRTTTTGFSSLERIKQKPLEVTDVTVPLEKVHKPPRAPTPASGGSACIVASNMSPRPYVPQDETEDSELFEASPQPGVNVLFHISDEESDEVCGDDVIEKDNTSSVLTKPFSSQTSPIDIPSRSNSVSSSLSRSPSRKRSSTSSSNSISKLGGDEMSPPPTNLPSSPPRKDLSAIPPAKPPWTERLVNWLLKPSMYSDSARPTHVIGCKMT